MSAKSIPAIYENGVFKPQSPVNLNVGARVEVILPEESIAVSEEQMKARYPKSWGVLAPDDAEQIRKAIGEAKSEIGPDAWR